MQDRFLWGVATSAHQIEGNNQHSDWWAWEHDTKSPCKEPSGQASLHLHHWKEDLTLARDLIDVKAYRFSIEWAKLKPTPSEWDESYFNWVIELLRTLKTLDLEPMITLHHFTNPLWFSQKGGWARKNAHIDFVHYVEELLEKLEQHLGKNQMPQLWIPFNEPMPLALGAYVGGFQPPGVFSPQKAALALEEILYAQAALYQRLHRLSVPGVKVGVAQNQFYWRAERAWSPIDQALSRYLRFFYNEAWIECALGKRTRFGIPGFLRIHLDHTLKQSLDFLGINYYTEAIVGLFPKERDPHIDTHSKFSRLLGLRFSDHLSGRDHSDLNWVISPEGFDQVLMHAKKRFPELPLFITENGLADANDSKRAAFLNAHLEILEKHRAQPHPILGYFHWSLLDNFEWIEGFAPRFGLISVNYQTGERNIRNSASQYRTWIQNAPPGSKVTQS